MPRSSTLGVLTRFCAILLLAISALGLNPMVARAATNDTLIFTPVADAYVDASLPGSSFGSSTSLWVDAQPAKQSFVRFSVSGVSGRSVVGVHLKVLQRDASPSGGRVFSISSNSWTESVTWNTRPSIDGPQLASFGAVQAGVAYTADLGANIVSGNGPLNLAMDSTNSDGANWGSREYSSPPQLIVDLSPRPVPSNVDRFTFNPVADTYVDASLPASSFGTASSFWVDSSPAKQSFVRFSVSGLAGRTVEDVRLRLYQTDASPQGGRAFSISSNSWSESMTWNTRPPIDGPELGAFGQVSSGRWYEIDLGPILSGDGTVNLALDSVNSDGARWSSREGTNQPKLIVLVDQVPGLVLDGLSTVAGTKVGSSDPTYYANQHHVALTSGGRLLVVYGRHSTGVQLAWRDAGGGWQTDTTGAVTDGQLLSGSGTGDWPASIVVAQDSSGNEHAWAVWARVSFSFVNGVSMRRLSNLDSPGGPTVGPVVTVESAGLGTAKADLGFEIEGSTPRGVVMWTRKTGDTTWAIVATWFTNLDTDTPTFGNTAVLSAGSGTSSSGTLIPSSFGMRAGLRDGGGKVHMFGHDVGTPLGTWWSGTQGMAVPSGARVSGIAFSSGQLVASAETDTTNHVVTVQVFNSQGQQPQTKLSVNGFAQPVLASDGSTLYLVMIRSSDGFVVSRSYDGASWSAVRVEIGAEGGGNYSWPNILRQTDGRIRLIVRGPSGGPSQTAVLAFQRVL
jgi:hypothetical protein